MQQFIKDLDSLHINHMFRFDCNRKVPELTDEEWQRYNSTKNCENCGKEFGTRRQDGSEVYKVKHHDHVTDKFIGAWCSKCNIRNNNRYFKTIVVFHNFSGYDGHFIIKYASKYMSSGRNGRFHAPQIVCATIEPNTGKIPILHPLSHT
jgi:hypothetical protein